MIHYWSTQSRGPPLALSQCPQSNEFNGSLIRATTIILWHVEAHLLKDFKDMCWIPTWSIEWKPCIKMGFSWVMKVCLGIFHVAILATCSQSRNLQSWSLCAKISHSLTEQKPIGFQGHLLNPYPGHRMETMHQNGLSVGHARIFRQVPFLNTSHTFTFEEFVKLALCAKIGHSLTKQNPSFQNWPKKWSLVHGPRLEAHP